MLEMRQNLIEALEIASMPNSEQSKSAEDFLLNKNVENQEFIRNLMTLTIDQSVQEKTQMLAAIVLKKNVKKNWRVFSQDVKNLLMQEILNLFANLRNLKILQIFSQIFYHLLLLNPPPQNWQSLEPTLYGLMVQNINNTEVFYPLLIAFKKLISVREHAPESKRKIYRPTQIKFFELIDTLLQPLMEAQITPQTLSYTETLCKIFTKTYRYEVDEYLIQPEKTKKWMEFFINLLQKQDPGIEKTKKWVLKGLVPFFRNFTKIKDDCKCKDYAIFWQNNYLRPFFDVVLMNLNNLKPEAKNKQVVFQLSRCFHHFISFPQTFEQYKQTCLDLFNQKFVYLIQYTEEDLEQYQMDPIEFFKINDYTIYSDDFRTSFASMTNALAQNKLINEIVNILIQKLNNSNSPSEKEAIFYYIQKLFLLIEREDSLGQNFIKNFFEQYVLPNMDNPQGFMRMRCCILVNTFNEFFQESPLLNVIVEKVCIRLEDPDMPVKSFAAIALEKLLLLKQVVDLVRPYINNILVIYINLINECDNESLINSLVGIFDSFNDDLGPYVMELIQKMVEIIINIVSKKYVKPEDEEESQFSILSSFQTIPELLKACKDQSQLPQIYNIMEPLFLKIFESQDIEQFDECMELFNILISKHDQDTLLPVYFNYLQYFCFGFNEIQINDFSQNPLLKFLKNSKLYFYELETVLVKVMRNFVVKCSDLDQKKDYFGNSYISLIINCLENIQSHQQNHMEYDLPVSSMIFEANLASILIVRNSNYQDYFVQILNKNIINFTSMNEQQKKSQSMKVNIFWHNLGVMIFAKTQEVLEYLQTNHQNFLQNLIPLWMQDHRQQLTYKMRKSSFLGLMSLVKIQGVISNQNEFMGYLLMDLLIQHYQNKRENEPENYDFLDDDDPVTEIQIQLKSEENIKKFLEQNESFKTLESEILYNYETQYNKDQVDTIDQIQLIKQLLHNSGLNQNQLLNLLPQIDQNLKVVLFKILGINQFV